MKEITLKNYERASRIVLLTVLLIAGSTAAFAQHGYRVTKQINFAKGKTSARVTGTIPGLLEGHEYLFRARRGQTVTIGLFCDREDIGFLITEPDGETIDDAVDARSWHGELPATGVYHIIINTQSDGRARYTLDVSIE